MGGPATSTSSTTRPGATVAMASARPGVRTTRTTPVPSARMPAAIGGRFGPEPHDVLARQQHPHRSTVLVGQPAGDRARPRWRPCRRRRRRWRAATPARHRARTRRRRARGRPGSTQVVRSVRTQSPGGSSSGQLSADGRAPALDLARRRPAPRPAVSPTTQEPSAARTATRASAGAVSSANPPSPSATRGATRWAPRPSRVARRRGGMEVAGRVRRAGCDRPGSPPRRIVCHPVQRQRWASSAWSHGTGVPGSAPASRTMIPGVQNPHWLAPAAQKASAHRSPSGRPSRS